MKHPNTKHQIPMKHQAPNSKKPEPKVGLDVGCWNFSGAWMLELGAFSA
jgi:hypothetical protein